VVCYEFYFKNDKTVHDCRSGESSILTQVQVRDTFTDSERYDVWILAIGADDVRTTARVLAPQFKMYVGT
jgi:hypothetical protein